MSEPILGQIQTFAFPFAPRAWMTCSGQILPITQNTALFSLIGTTYGGNGQTTFGLPDLRGRVAMSQGQGPGLPSTSMGEMAGTGSVTLLPSNLPAHSHPVNVSSAGATTDQPANGFLAQAATPELGVINVYGPALTAGVTLSPSTIGPNFGGASSPVNIMQPYLTINFCICVSGIFPSRN